MMKIPHRDDPIVSYPPGTAPIAIGVRKSLAGIFETCWAAGMKLSHVFSRAGWTAFTELTMTLSVWLLALAMSSLFLAARRKPEAKLKKFEQFIFRKLSVKSYAHPVLSVHMVSGKYSITIQKHSDEWRLAFEIDDVHFYPSRLSGNP